MKNFKLVKTTAALALGASVVTAAVVPAATSASAASKYKVSNGKLVNAKTGKVVKGYVVFKSKLYYNGKLKKGYKTVGSGKTIKLYYNGSLKKGYKTANNKKLLFFNGSLKKGYKTAGEGERLYKDGYLDKGYEVYGDIDKNPSLYYNGYLKSGYKTANNATLLFYNGKLKEGYKTAKEGTVLYKDGRLNKGLALVEEKLYKDSSLNKGLVLFEDKLYKDSSLNKGLALFEDKLYKDSSLNEGLALFEDKLYKDSSLNKGLEKYEEKFYFDGELADGTYEHDGKEIAIEKGIEVGAKVKAVEVINGTTIEVKFNKAVDKDEAENVANVKVQGVTFATRSLSEDGRTLTLTSASAIDVKDSTVTIEEIATKADKEVKTPKYVQVLTYKDTVAPTLVSASSAIQKVTGTQETKSVTVTFSEPVVAAGSIAYVNGEAATVAQGSKANELVINFDKAAKVGESLEVKLTNVKDVAGNTINPNPATISTTVQAADAVAPAVTGVTTKSTKDGLTVTFAYNKEVTNATVDSNKTYLSANGISVGTLNTPQVAKDGKSITYKVELVKAANDAFTKDGKLFATLYVQEGLVVDKADNKSAAFSQSVSFEADKTAPVLVSSDYKEGKLVLNFDEAVTAVTAKKAITIVKYNPITGNETTVTPGDLTSGVLSNDGKTVTVDLGLVAGTEDATYKVSYVEGALVDASNNAVAAFSKTIQVKKAEATAKDTKAPEVDTTTTAATLKGSNYELTYKVKDLKDTTATVAETESGLDFSTILNASNYTLGGKALPANAKISTDVEKLAEYKGADTVTVTITIPKSAITAKLVGPLTVTGIKDVKGNTNTTITASSSLTLNEGIAPVLADSKLVDNTVILGFSEEMNKVNTGDLKVTINNVDVTISAADLTAETTGSDKGKYYLSLASLVKEQSAVTGVAARSAGFYASDSSLEADKFTSFTTPVVGDKFVTDGNTYEYKAAVENGAAQGWYDELNETASLPTTFAEGDEYIRSGETYTYSAEVKAVAPEAAYKYIELDGKKVKLSKDTLADSPEITSIKLTTVDAPTASKDLNDNLLTGKTVITVK